VQLFDLRSKGRPLPSRERGIVGHHPHGRVRALHLQVQHAYGHALFLPALRNSHVSPSPDRPESLERQCSLP